MDDAFRVQNKIRENARTIQEFSNDLKNWESSIKKKDEQLRNEQRKQKLTYAADPEPISTTSTKTSEDGASAASHCYDKGYQKWEKFDVDEALNDENVVSQSKPVSSGPAVPPLTPAMIVEPHILHSKGVHGDDRPVANVDATPVVAKPRDVLERERGNEYFSKGNMEQAVKFYTRAVGFNPNSVTAFSNRAMAHLKLKDFLNADADCCDALAIDENHVKSLLRRATARNALGRHHAAFLDLNRARELEPSNKQALSQMNRTRELIKSSVRRAPQRELNVQICSDKAERPCAGTDASSVNTVELPIAGEPSKDSSIPTEKTLSTDSPNIIAEKSDPSEGKIANLATSAGSTGDDDSSETLAAPSQASALKVASTSEKESKPISTAPIKDDAQQVKERAKASLAKQPVHTFYEFGRVWKELQSYPAHKFSWITEALKATGITQVFKSSAPEADLFIEIVELLCERAQPHNYSDVESVLRAIGNVKGLDMTLMFLSSSDKQKIRSDLERLKEQGATGVGGLVQDFKLN
mmetsp:Transcript_12063/g.21524  ORF Transcript_12063/g.21524 Transcript_12063/m.21524 type:complete len:526 (-) Transcript_12063:202-1779(-)